MIQGFVTFFTETSFVTWIVLAVSLACLISEVFIPSFGMVGIGGIVLGIAGIVFNATKPWLSAGEIIWLVVDTLILFAIIVGAVKLIDFIIRKKGGIRKKVSAYLEIDGKKIPADSNGNPNFSFLKGKAGVCVTDLNPSGKVEIDGDIYNVFSREGYLYNGNMVRVVKTVGASIYVEKIQG